MTKEPGSRAKLQTYFLEHVGEVLDSETLRLVAGTSEWGAACPRVTQRVRNEQRNAQRPERPEAGTIHVGRYRTAARI